MVLHNSLVMPSSRSLLLIPKRRLITHCYSAMRKSQHSRKKKVPSAVLPQPTNSCSQKYFVPTPFIRQSPRTSDKRPKLLGASTYLDQASCVPQVGVSHPEELLALPLAPLKAAPLRVWGHLWILFLLLGLFCFQCSRPHTDICALLLLFGL